MTFKRKISVRHIGLPAICLIKIDWKRFLCYAL